MDKIEIRELEVYFRVGVPEQEREAPQRLLISVTMELDFSEAATSDDLSCTIDYDAVCRRIRNLGDDQEWKLIEKLAGDIAGLILKEFKPQQVTVEVKKFIFEDTKHVGVSLTRSNT